jgi:LacI family transcriptional regulator
MSFSRITHLNKGEIMGKPTLMDVATTAGVSYATADRVLNKRGGVAEKSVRRVTQAIEQLGYERDVTAANLARGRSYDFTFLIPTQAGAFFEHLRAAVSREAQNRMGERISITLEDVPAFDPERLADALEACATRPMSGLCLVAIDSPRVRAAVDALRAKGVVVVTLVADLKADHRDAYIGLDNAAAGRTAGRLIALSHRSGGTVLPIAGSLSAVDHAQRYAGFMERMPNTVTVLPVIEAFDQPDAVRRAVTQTLEAHPDLSGIYNIGAGHDGLFDALTALKTHRPLVVLHDLATQVRAALDDGLADAVIDQKPSQQIAMALDAMRSLSDGASLPTDFGTIIPSLHFQDNLPPAPADGHAEG